ncbi:MAG: hypothetical protein SGILL_002367, partial [Bacillariaceae sp.]
MAARHRLDAAFDYGKVFEQLNTLVGNTLDDGEIEETKRRIAFIVTAFTATLRRENIPKGIEPADPFDPNDWDYDKFPFDKILRDDGGHGRSALWDLYSFDDGGSKPLVEDLLRPLYIALRALHTPQNTRLFPELVALLDPTILYDDSNENKKRVVSNLVSVLILFGKANRHNPAIMKGVIMFMFDFGILNHSKLEGPFPWLCQQLGVPVPSEGKSWDLKKARMAVAIEMAVGDDSLNEMGARFVEVARFKFLFRKTRAGLCRFLTERWCFDPDIANVVPLNTDEIFRFLNPRLDPPIRGVAVSEAQVLGRARQLLLEEFENEDDREDASMALENEGLRQAECAVVPAEPLSPLQQAQFGLTIAKEDIYITRFIAETDLSVVVACRHVRNHGVELAAKILPSYLGILPYAAREIQNMSQGIDENGIRVYGYTVVKEELIKGVELAVLIWQEVGEKNLETVLKELPLPESEQQKKEAALAYLHIGIHALRFIHFLNSGGRVHRDVKPPNILVKDLLGLAVTYASLLMMVFKVADVGECREYLADGMTRGAGSNYYRDIRYPNGHALMDVFSLARLLVYMIVRNETTKTLSYKKLKESFTGMVAAPGIFADLFVRMTCDNGDRLTAHQSLVALCAAQLTIKNSDDLDKFEDENPPAEAMRLQQFLNSVPLLTPDQSSAALDSLSNGRFPDVQLVNVSNNGAPQRLPANYGGVVQPVNVSNNAAQLLPLLPESPTLANGGDNDVPGLDDEDDHSEPPDNGHRQWNSSNRPVVVQATDAGVLAGIMEEDDEGDDQLAAFGAGWDQDDDDLEHDGIPLLNVVFEPDPNDGNEGDVPPAVAVEEEEDARH